MTTPAPRLFYLLNRARHALFKAADAVLLERLDITGAQLGALFVLGETPDCTPGDLAERLDLNASAVTGLAERLERAGFIARRPHDDDRRVTLLSLTDAGRERVRASKPLMAEVNRRIVEGYSAEDVALIARFLDTTAQRFAPPRKGLAARVPEKPETEKKRRVTP
ncbi:MarR family winged helix-turn-helix transcriptional regulator [Zavarzinia compransoris]|nr:MarR family transcriptional regulator [Zavarzinia compransoris]TDP47013.1 DNA-binding MarR family transcriptional regulator [Zavarzinia compransoris]